MAATLVSAMGAEGAHHRDYISWAQQAKGVKIDGVEAASFPAAGIGIVATRQITAGEVLVFVPASALLTVNPDNGHKVGQGQFSVHGRLALTLLQTSETADEPSSSKLWMKAMPTKEDVFGGTPIKWSHFLQDLLPLEGKTLLETQKQNLDRDCSAYKSYCDAQPERLPHAVGSDAEIAYEHAWLLVNSRSFYWDYPKTRNSTPSYQGKKGKGTRQRPRNDCMALCPFIDYFNHTSGSDCAQVEYNMNGFTVRSDRDYAAGEEINVSYGAHSNDFLMVEYGFIMDDLQNESDWAMLDHFILPSLSGQARQQLADQGLLGKYALDMDGNVCHRTECAMRCPILPELLWEHFVAGCYEGNSGQSGANEELKEQVFKPYATLIEATLQQLDSMEPSYARYMLMTRWRQIGKMVHKAQNNKKYDL